MDPSRLSIGDIVFVHDKRWYNLVSTAIMACETDEYTNPFKGTIPYHVAGMYIGRNLLIESVWGEGVRLMELSNYLGNKDLVVWAKRLKQAYWSENPGQDRADLQKWLEKQKGLKYDKSQIIGIFWRSFLRVIPPFYRFLKKHGQLGTDSRYRFICSELLFCAYLAVLGVNLYPSASSANVTPHDLNRSDKLETV